MAARRSNKTRSQGKEIAANEGAASKLLFRVPVTNVELWGVAVDGCRVEDGLLHEGQGVWKKNLGPTSTEDQPFQSRGYQITLRCLFSFLKTNNNKGIIKIA